MMYDVQGQMEELEAVASLMPFLLLCLAVQIVVGGLIGRKKGRAFEGALWGLALGVIGWIIIAFREPTLEIRVKREMEEAKLRKELYRQYGPNPR